MGGRIVFYTSVVSSTPFKSGGGCRTVEDHGGMWKARQGRPHAAVRQRATVRMCQFGHQAVKPTQLVGNASWLTEFAKAAKLRRCEVSAFSFFLTLRCVVDAGG